VYAAQARQNLPSCGAGREAGMRREQDDAHAVNNKASFAQFGGRFSAVGRSLSAIHGHHREMMVTLPQA